MPRVPPKNRRTSKETPAPAPSGAEKGDTGSHPLAQDTVDLGGKIHTLRGIQVMLDRDLAELYGTTPRRLRQQVKRNQARFPDDFMFQLNDSEVEIMVSQNVTPSQNHAGRTKVSQNAIPSWKHLGGTMPYAFTEQGVASLSAVLTSQRAIQVHIAIMRAFVAMRRILQANAGLIQRLDGVERRQVAHETETDKRFEQVFTALEGPNATPRQGIFYDGQVYDAHTFVSDLIRSARKSIVLIDNYVDDTVLTLLGKRREGVSVALYTRSVTPEFILDLKKHNAQYPPVEVREFKDAHDRFLILDGESLYHLGASLKDLGKKWFAFSRFEKGAVEMLERLG